MKFFRKNLITLLFIMVFCFGVTGLIVKAQQMTDAQRQALIAQIQQQIIQLQQQLAQLVSQQQGTNLWCFTFNNNLGISNSGANDVANLHIALQQQGISYSPDAINIYSTGTSEAVIQFQAKYEISPQSGYVGVLTRAKLNSLYGCSTAASTVCTPNWQCNNWNTCSNGQQTRYCHDSNTCGTTTNEPVTGQSCTSTNCSSNNECGSTGFTGNRFCQSGNVYQIYVTYTCNKPGTYSSYCTSDTTAQLVTTCAINQYCKNGSCTICTPSWSCTGFGSCINGVQTQICTDANNCHDATGEPSQAQSCNSYNNSSTTTDCTPTWQCNSWNSCSGGQQTRYCYDSNNCGTTTGEPTTTQSCTCTPNWQCNSWDVCSSGQQTRYCYDYNNCGITTGEPPITQSCT
jgi:hypothetical protein